MSGEPGPSPDLVSDHDRSVWLEGPRAGVERPQTWLRRELPAARERLGVGRWSREGRMLGALLPRFAAHQDRATTAFLRLSEPWQAHLVVLVHAWSGNDTWRFAAAFREYDERDRYLGEAETEIVDAGLGLHRSLRVVDDPDGPTGLLRYHRRIDDLAADICVFSSGAPVDEVRAALPDTDALARSLHVLDAQGDRR